MEHNIKGSPASLTFLYLPNETMHKGASDLQLKQSRGKGLPWWCGRPLVAKLGVSTVAGEVTKFTTLIAAQVGVIATSHPASPHPWPGLSHLNATVANCAERRNAIEVRQQIQFFNFHYFQKNMY